MDSAKSHRWMGDPGFPFNPSINITVGKSGYVWPGCGSGVEHSSTTHDILYSPLERGSWGERRGREQEKNGWEKLMEESIKQIRNIHSTCLVATVTGNGRRWKIKQGQHDKDQERQPSSVGKSVSSGLSYLSSDIPWLFLCLLSFCVEWQY